MPERKSRDPTACDYGSPGPARDARDETDRKCRRRRRCSCVSECGLPFLLNHLRQLAHELLHTVAGDRRDLVILVTVLLRIRAQLLAVAFERGVGLRSAHEPRLLGECLGMQPELVCDDLRIFLGMIVRGEIDEMKQRRATLDVTQELVTEAVTFVRPFDETRNVGYDECLIVIRPDNAEIRSESSKGIVGDLWLRRADDGDQRRFSRIRKSDDADIGDQLQLDEKLALFAFVARLRESRRLTGRCREMLVAPPAAPALRNLHALALGREVGENIAGLLVAHDRSDRKLDDDVAAVLSGAIRAEAMFSTASAPLALKLKVVERVQ